MHGLFGALKLSENVVELNPVVTQEQRDRVTRIKEWTDAAQVEIDSDFALLHSHSLMGVWGALEATVDDVAAGWIEHTNGVTADSAFAKLKVNVVQFLATPESQRHRFLIAELKRDLGSSLRTGVAQFEGLLKAVGLGGDVPAGVRRALVYAQQIRNVVAHRGGIADQRFVLACPALPFAVGDKVTVTSEQFFDLIGCFSMYAVVIADRIRARTGMRLTGIGIPEQAGHTFAGAGGAEGADLT